MKGVRWLLSGPMVPPGTREWRGTDGELLRSLSPTGLGAIESVLSFDPAYDRVPGLTRLR